MRELLQSRGFPSVAAEGYKAPGVVVSYTTDPEIQSGRAFLKVGLQTASGVPLQCDEGPDFKTFRIGLFGLDKWHDSDRSVAHLSKALAVNAFMRTNPFLAEKTHCARGLPRLAADRTQVNL